MKKFSLLFLILIIFFSSSCIKKENNLKIIILDEFGNKISKAKVLINEKEFLSDENGELILNNYENEFKILIYKENYLPYEANIKSENLETLEIRLTSLNSKKDEITNKIIEKISQSKKFNVQFLGNLNGDIENFNLYCDLENSYFKITSDLLEKELEIKKENGKFYYNQNELPDDTLNYFSEVIDLISESIEFVKTLYNMVQNKELSISYNYIKLSFKLEKTNLKISGFIISNYPNYEIINEQMNIVAIDEMGRVNDFTLNFYNFN